MSKTIVTTGFKYTDIDGLACCIAYAELLRLIGRDAVAYLPAVINQSCPDFVQKAAEDKYITALEAEDYNTADFVLEDICIVEQIDPQINPKQIIEVFDHHLYGGDSYWKDKPNVKVVIEEIGACATLVWQEYKKLQLQNKISPQSAKLLYTAIISNSLYLKASITKDADHKAYNELHDLAFISEKYDQQYFSAVDQIIMQDIESAIQNDAKDFVLDGKSFRVIQMELWNGEQFIRDNEQVLANHLKTSEVDYAFFTCPSISRGINYLLAYQQESKDLITKLLGAKFEGDIAKTDKIFLRKEIKSLLHKLQ